MHTICKCGHNQMHRAVHFKCKDTMFHNQLKWMKIKLKPYFLHGKDWQLNAYQKLITINDTTIVYVPMIWDQGITLDSSLSFNQQVINTCQSAFYELRRISSVRKYLTRDATKTIVYSLGLTIATASCLDDQISQWSIKPYLSLHITQLKQFWYPVKTFLSCS